MVAEKDASKCHHITFQDSIHSAGSTKTRMEDKSTLLHIGHRLKKDRAQIVSCLNILCAFGWNSNLYPMYRISISFMTKRKQLLCSTLEGLLVVCTSFSSSNLTQSTHLATCCLLRNCLSFLFLLYSLSACAASPQWQRSRRKHNVVRSNVKV